LPQSASTLWLSAIREYSGWFEIQCHITGAFKHAGEYHKYWSSALLARSGSAENYSGSGTELEKKSEKLPRLSRNGAGAFCPRRNVHGLLGTLLSVGIPQPQERQPGRLQSNLAAGNIYFTNQQGRTIRWFCKRMNGIVICWVPRIYVSLNICPKYWHPAWLVSRSRPDEISLLCGSGDTHIPQALDALMQQEEKYKCRQEW